MSTQRTFASVHPIGIIFLIIIALYLGWSAFSADSLQVLDWTIPNLSLRLAIAQMLITSLDWALAAAVLYQLLPSATPLSYGTFFSVYQLAQIAGVVSNVPGGLGIFETVMLVLVSPPIAANGLFAALIVYRGIYYFLPLSVSLVLLGRYKLC